MMMNKTIYMVMVGCAVLGACKQRTPSMMNTERVELSTQTGIDQVPVAQANDGYLSALAGQYGRYGEGPINLIVSYDPASKSYNSTKAINDLAMLSGKLARKGLNNVVTSTQPMTGQSQPMLMVSYDMVTAQGPSNCGNMQGLYDNTTTPDINGYRFGCGVEQMVARQISRPADLRGRGTVDTGDGRRATNVTESYRGQPPEAYAVPLETYTRQDIQQ